MTPTARGWREISMRALALCLAGVIWVVAGSEKSRTASTPTFDTVRDARVVVKNVPQGMVVTEVPSSVTVRLRGTRGLEATASDADIIAVVNMAGVTSGQHLLAAEPLPPSGLEVVRSGAIVVGVTVEELVSAEFEVEATISANLASEGIEEVNAVPSRARVQGPKAAVDRVSRVVALALAYVEDAPGEDVAETETEARGGSEDQGKEEGPADGPMAAKPQGALAALLALDDKGEVVQGVEMYPGSVLVRWKSR